MKVVILGANSFIARALSAEMLKEGWDVLMASRNTEELERVTKDLGLKYGKDVKFMEFDATDYETHKRFWDNVLKDFGDIDVAVISFGYLGDNDKALKDFSEVRKIVETNYLGAISIINIISDYMEHRGKGIIVAISSVAGDRGRAKNFIYGSAKAGLTQYLSGLRAKMFKKGVKVITVKPGFVNTPMTKGLNIPKPLLSTPERVAKDIFKAIKKGKDIVYTPFYWWFIMLVIRAIPEWMFKRLDF